MTVEQWQNVIDVNLSGTLLLQGRVELHAPEKPATDASSMPFVGSRALRYLRPGTNYVAMTAGLIV